MIHVCSIFGHCRAGAKGLLGLLIAAMALPACGPSQASNETATRTAAPETRALTGEDAETRFRTQMLDFCQGRRPDQAVPASACQGLADAFVAHIKQGSVDQASLPSSGGCWGNFMVAVYPKGGGFPTLTRMHPVDALDTAIAASKIGRRCEIYDSRGRLLPLL